MSIEHLSYSSINLFTRDPLGWKRGYVDGEWEPPSDSLKFGKAFHWAIHNKLVFDDEGFVESWNEAFKNEFGEDDNQELHQKGVDMFSLEETQRVIDALNVAKINGEVAQEVPVSLHIPNIPLPLIGFIDLIEDTPDGLLAVDFKTSRASWNEKRANEEMQATVYIAALNQMGLVSLPARFKYLIFVKTKTPKVQEFIVEKTIDDVMKCMSQIEEVWGMMKGVLNHE